MSPEIWICYKLFLYHKKTIGEIMKTENEMRGFEPDHFLDFANNGVIEVEKLKAFLMPFVVEKQLSIV